MTPSERMTENDLLELQLRMKITQESIDQPSPDHYFDTEADDDKPESKLANDIRAYAKKKGWPCLVHPRSKMLSWFLPIGYADIVLSIPYGITLYLEIKKQKGIWRKEQQLMGMQWKQLGHQYHVLKTWKGFLQLIDSVLRRE